MKEKAKEKEREREKEGWLGDCCSLDSNNKQDSRRREREKQCGRIRGSFYLDTNGPEAFTVSYAFTLWSSLQRKIVLGVGDKKQKKKKLKISGRTKIYKCGIEREKKP